MEGQTIEPVRLDVLGPLVLRRGDREITPSSPIARRLLCLLACRAPSTVSTHELVEVAWPDGTSPKEPEQNLHTHVARIRRLGGAPRGESGLVETQPGGYRLAAGAVALDLDLLAELTALGLEADDDPSTAARLTRALSLWRGPSLDDIADTEAGQGDAVRLDELRLSITEARFESLLAGGAPAELVTEVEAFTHQHPYRERPHAVLMRALNDRGRHADALAAYQRLRRRLADDLGLEPSPALRALEADVLAHRLTAPRAAPAEEVPPRSDATPPAPLTPLVGRAEALSRVTAAAGRSRLVTLVGGGGVGKTRLAQEVARQWGDEGPAGRRILWCDLSSAEDEAGVVDLLALAVRARRRSGEAMRAAAVRAVAEAEPLLVLDNCEQVAEAGAEIVADLLGRSGQVRILATSRTPFDIPGEAVVRLEPLRYEPSEGEDPDVPPPAVALFLERCAEVGLDVRAGDPDLSQATRICRSVDGLPLGIELAAAQVRNLPLPQLARRLDDEQGPLEVSRRRGPAWQRSIGATLEWSYRLLSPGDQRLLAAVSAFPGSFDGAGVAALIGAEDRVAVEDRLRDLADLSLVTVTPTADDLRFRLLGTTRGFGRGILVEEGRYAEVAARHRDWARELVEAQHVALQGAGEPTAARAIALATDDLRAVVTHATDEGDVDTALAVCCSLGEFAFHRLRDDAYDWTDRALALPGADEHLLAVRARASLALGLTSRGDLTRAAGCAEQALAAASDDLAATVLAHHALGLAALYSGRLGDAVATAGTLQALAAANEDDLGVRAACTLGALACLYGGDHDGALEWTGRLTEAAAHSAQPTAEAWAQYCLGEVMARTDPGRAAGHLGRAISIGETVDNEFVIGVAEVSLAAMQATGPDARAALRAFGSLIRRWDARNDWTHQWTTLQNVAPLAARSGSAADAAVLVGALTGVMARPLFGGAAEDIAALEHGLAAELGTERFEELRAEGAALSRREVIALALRLTEGA